VPRLLTATCGIASRRARHQSNPDGLASSAPNGVLQRDRSEAELAPAEIASNDVVAFDIVRYVN